jgi:acylaminoacyl-peptidase
VYSIGPAQGDFKLRIQEPDGDNARTIDHRRMESVPSWSPDGKQLAFLVRTPPDQHDELWISDADGSGAHHVLNRSVSWVSWSPDGKWIAFVDSQDSKNNIAIVRPDGTGLRTLSDFRIATPQDVDLWEHSWGRLTWSTDSRLVATAVSGTPPHYEKHSDIWIWDIETRVHRVISTGSLGAVMDPAWSPDGKTIVFSAREGDGDNDLWRVPADGGRVSQLTTIPGSESQPAWSPDGKHLAFLWDTDSRHRPTDAPRVNSGVGSGDALSDIAVLRLSDGQYAPVTSGVTTLQFPDGPAWCPTGS